MIRFCRVFLLFAFVLSGLNLSLWAEPVIYTLSPASAKKQITFESKAPSEYIEGSAEEFSGSATLDADKPDLGLKASVFVPVSGLRTGISLRDEHLRSSEWLSAEKFPVIQFDLTSVPSKNVSAKGNSEWFVQAEGTFSLKGKTKTISVPLKLRREKVGNDMQLHVQGRFPVKLSDFGIYGPAGIRMIGLKISEEVSVNLKLVGVVDRSWDNYKKKKSLR